MKATQTQETKTYSGKKALVLYGEDYLQKKEINIYDELEYKHRIIEELAGMSLENDPMLNCKEELKDVPLVYWPKEAWENKTHTEINQILEEKEEEFDGLLADLIIEQMPEFKITESDYLCFHEFYNTSKEDNENNIFLRFTVDKYSENDETAADDDDETYDLIDFLKSPEFKTQKALADKIVLGGYKGDFDKLKPLNLSSKDSENLDQLCSELSMVTTSFQFNLNRAQDKKLGKIEMKIGKIALLKSIESTQGIWADIYKLLNK